LIAAAILVSVFSFWNAFIPLTLASGVLLAASDRLRVGYKEGKASEDSLWAAFVVMIVASGITAGGFRILESGYSRQLITGDMGLPELAVSILPWVVPFAVVFGAVISWSAATTLFIGYFEEDIRSGNFRFTFYWWPSAWLYAWILAMIVPWAMWILGPIGQLPYALSKNFVSRVGSASIDKQRRWQSWLQIALPAAIALSILNSVILHFWAPINQFVVAQLAVVILGTTSSILANMGIFGLIVAGEKAGFFKPLRTWQQESGRSATSTSRA